MNRFSLFRRGLFHRWLLLPGMTALTLIIIIIVSWQPVAIANTALFYNELEFPPLGDIEFPPYERYELSNGLVVYLMEDHELPLISGSATFSAGTRFEPAEKVGLGNVMGDAMRLGGTETLSPDQLNRELEQRAAAIETSLALVSGSASFNALSEDVDTILRLFADVIEHPAFANDRIELLKTQYSGTIARRNDNPDDVASREFRKLVYGVESPYARTLEYSTLNAVSRSDIIDFYNASIQPDRTILGIVGDFDPDQLKGLIEQYFGSWQAIHEPLEISELPPATQTQTGTYFVEQPQLTQSYVQIGHIGGQLSSPDHAPLSVLNEVLNGFGGRLFNEVRSRQGLAYLVYAFWAPRYDYPGLFIGGGQTRSDATVPFIESIKAEIQRVRTTAISSEELARAKDSVLNSFVFNFESVEQSLSRLIRYEYYDYPRDFVFQFREAVEKTTAEDVLKAAAENLHPDQLVTLVVGNSADIEPSLAALESEKPVQEIDISIPEAS